MMEGTGGWGYVRTVVVPVAVLVAAILAAGCGSSDSGEDVSLTGDGYPNGDLANTRNDQGGPINVANVGELTRIWTRPIKGESAFGSYAASPVLVNGIIYSQDLGSNVEALDAENGDVLWTKSFEQPSLGPNGVVVSDGAVFGSTSSAVFALDQKTGKQLWSTTLVHNEVEGINMAPGYDDGVVYASTVPTNAASLYEPGGVGILWALDAKTGKKLWHFDTVPKDLWGHPEINSGGGVWYTPAFDGKGSMYFGVGNPAPFPGTEGHPWGSSRPGPNLYTNSIVKLNAKTGKMDWYFQLNPHDLYDWDLQGPPILVEQGGREMVVAGGKVGYVIALDAQTGKLIWKRAVGKHNGHDNDGLLAMRGETSKLKTPFEIYPGNLGGVIAQMSTDGTHVFAAVVNHPVTLASGTEIQEASAVNKGELVALNLKDGSIAWRHEFPNSPTFGATSVANEIVYTTTYDGYVWGFTAKDGKPVWQAVLPAGTNAGVTVAENKVIAPAGVPSSEGQKAQLAIYRLGG